MSDVTAEFQKLHQKRRAMIFGMFSNANEVQADDAALHKAEGDAGDNVEKSDIMNAISGYGDSKIKLQKTGKEIKEQVDTVILPALNADLAAKKVEADAKLKDCGAAPTQEPQPWWTGDVKMEVGYKIYDWCEMEFCSPERARMYPTLSAEDSESKKRNCPTSEAEERARREYNEKVRCICNILVDIKACEILKTLKDSTNYELTPRQVLALKFA